MISPEQKIAKYFPLLSVPEYPETGDPKRDCPVIHANDIPGGRRYRSVILVNRTESVRRGNNYTLTIFFKFREGGN